MRGSVIISYVESKQTFSQPLYEITINGSDTRDYQWSEAQGLYSTYIFSGNTLTTSVRSYGYGEIPFISLFLLEYTNDSVNGDNGLKTTFLTGVTGNNVDGILTLSNIPINPSPNCYDFTVLITAGAEQNCAPIGIISGVTGSGNIYANTSEIKIKNIGTTTQDVGDIYIGLRSDFTVQTYSGATAFGSVGRVFRVSPTYQLDDTFNTSSSLGTTYLAINDIDIQNDGRVIVGGGQSTTTGYSLNRLTTVGALDPTFTRYIFNGGSESVTDMVQQSDGKIITTGGFTQITGLTYNRYARFNYNGTIDNTYYSGGTSTGFNGAVSCEIDIRNNKVYYFTSTNTTFNGSTFGGILRLNTNGTLDTTFNGTGRGGFNQPGGGFVEHILPLSNGKILCYGFFNTYNGQPCPNGIVMLNEDGTLDTTFNQGGSGLTAGTLGFGAGTTERLNDINENAFLIIGKFYGGVTYNGVSIPNGIFFINRDGSLGNNTNLGTGIISSSGLGNPRTLKTLPNGNYFITGQDLRFNGTTITNGGMIQLSPTGQLQNC